jgi:hypothetical protein
LGEIDKVLVACCVRPDQGNQILRSDGFVLEQLDQHRGRRVVIRYQTRRIGGIRVIAADKRVYTRAERAHDCSDVVHELHQVCGAHGVSEFGVLCDDVVGHLADSLETLVVVSAHLFLG